MQIQVDTREHRSEWERIKSQFDSLGVSYFRSKLFVGDYCNLDNPRLVIDRKKDLTELCGNVCQQHERFRAELQRAMLHGIKIIFLVEHGYDVETLEDVYFWENPRRKIYTVTNHNGIWTKGLKYPKATTGEQLYKALVSIEQRYGVRFEFCTKNCTGQRIVDLLKGGAWNGE